AVSSEESIDEIPDVPTFKESGYDIVSDISRIYAVPKGLSDEKLNKLREGFNEIGKNEDYQNEMETTGQPVKWINGEDLEDKIKEYHTFAEEIVEKYKLDE